MTSPTPESNPHTTISTTHTNHPVYTHLLAKAFTTDPVFTYIEAHTPWYNRPALTYHIIRAQLLAAAHNNRALFISATSTPATSPPPSEQHVERNPHCTAVVLPPGTSLLAIGLAGWTHLLLRGVWRVLFQLGVSGWTRFENDYITPVEAAKATVFARGETYFYVAMIGTGAQHRGKGLARGVLSAVTGRAQAEGKPVWLEASSPGSRGVYLRCGFVDVGEGVVMGRGEVDGRGEAAVGEEAGGVPVFPMVWWPKGDPRRGLE